MKYAVEMASGVMVYTNFHKDCFSHSKVEGGGYRDTLYGDRISLLLFFKIRKVG
jgi:hypothetical protein